MDKYLPNFKDGRQVAGAAGGVFESSNLGFYSYGRNSPIVLKDPDGNIVPVLLAAWAVYEVASGAYDIYNAAKTVADPNATGAEKSIAVGGAVLSVVAPGGGYGTAGKVAAGAADKVGDAAKVADKVGDAAKGETTVVGRVKDLQNLKQGEKSLLDRLPDQGSPKENWKQNSGVLRQEMGKGQPIRDASPGDTAGQFLNAERNLLNDRGWTLDPKSNYWNPPAQ